MNNQFLFQRKAVFMKKGRKIAGGIMLMLSLMILGGNLTGNITTAKEVKADFVVPTAKNDKVKKQKKNKKENKKKKKTKPTPTPTPTFQPIVGKRVTKPNRAANAKKEQLWKKAVTAKNRISCYRESIQTDKKHLLELTRVQAQMNAMCSGIFIKKDIPSDTLTELSAYDSNLEKYKTYTLVSPLDGVVQAYRQLVSGDASLKANPSGNILTDISFDGIDLSNYILHSIETVSKNLKNEKLLFQKEKEKYKKITKQYHSVNSSDIVFNSKDITEVSNISERKLREILEGTALAKYAGVYVDMEKKYHVNAIAVCSLSALESDWGRSDRATRDHNFTGFGVYTDSSVGINAESFRGNMEMTVGHLARNYLTKGRYLYNGKGLDDVNKNYAAGKTWAYNIERIGYQLMDKID